MVHYTVPRPDSLELAKLVVGARCHTFYKDLQEWYAGFVKEVSLPEELDDPVNPDPELVPGTKWVYVIYRAQKGQNEDTEDMEWDQFFNGAPFRGAFEGNFCLVDWSSISPEVLERLGAKPVPPPAILQQLPPLDPPPPKARAAPKKRKQAAEEDPEFKRSKPGKQHRTTQGADGRLAEQLDWDGGGGVEDEPHQQLSSSQLQRRGDSDSSAVQPSQPQQQQQPGGRQRQQQGGGSQQQGGDSQQQWRPAGAARSQREARGGASGGGWKRQLPQGGDSDEEDGDFQQPPGPGQRRLMQAVDLTVRPGEGTAGQLKSLEIINFMCHEHFQMQFGPHVNIISGTNGSGKSAVLQALQCSMGVKAHATGRFKSAKEFIRHGQDQATVSVTLWNTGTDAYHPEQLGRELTIERRISRNGGNAFLIKNSQGGTVFKGTKEVEKLLDALSVNAANPAVVMTQDTARSFAGEQSESKKFQVFFEAMQLDEICQNLQKSAEALQGIRNLVEQDKEDLEARGAELQEKQQLLESLREVRDWKARKGTLSSCLAWEVVRAEEERIKGLREKMDGVVPERIAAHATLRATLQQQRDALDVRLAEQQARIEELNRRMQGHQRAVAEAKQEHKRKRDKLHELQRQLRERRRAVREYEAEVADLVASVQEVEEDIVRATQVEMATYKQRVQECKQQCDVALANLQHARQDVHEKEAEVQEAVQRVRDADGELREANNQIRRLQGELKRLEQGRGDPLHHFGGERMRAFLERVNLAAQQGKFQQPPIGPIGTLLALEDDKWAVAVECAIGRMLDGFIVHCVSDQRLLQKMAKEARMNLTCFIANFNNPQHVIPPERLVPVRVLTVMKVLKFKEGPLARVVKNVLVDQGRIERTVLAADDREAAATLRDGAFMDRYKIHQIWARDGSQARKRGRTETIQGPGRRVHPRLMKDASVHVQECRVQLEQAQLLGHQKQQELERRRKGEVEAKRALQTATREVKEANQRHAQTQGQYNTVASQRPVQAEPPAGPNDTAARVAELQNRIAAEQAQVGEAEMAAQQAEREEKEAHQRWQQAAQEPEAMTGEIEQCAQEVTSITEQNLQIEAQLVEVRKKEAALRSKLGELQEELGVAEERLPRFTAGALEVCSRGEAAVARARLEAEWAAEGVGSEQVAALLRPEAMDRRLRQLEAKIAKREENAGVAVEDLELLVERLERDQAKHQANHTKCTMLYSLLKQSNEARVRSYKKTRDTVGQVVSKQFHKYMKMRQHLAHISIDYAAERLVFHVGVNGGEVVKDMKSLSGGERSLSTVCFIMALGHAGLCPPWMALDEFDVFMDAVNRRFALMFLLQFAHAYSGRQFLFFTPQDVSAVEEAKLHLSQHRKIDLPADFVRIVRMRPARYNADRA